MVWLGSTTQLSKKYTTGTPSDTRYCARFPKVSDELLDTVHVPVKPVSHPFSSITGALVSENSREPADHVARGSASGEIAAVGARIDGLDDLGGAPGWRSTGQARPSR